MDNKIENEKSVVSILNVISLFVCLLLDILMEKYPVVAATIFYVFTKILLEITGVFPIKKWYPLFDEIKWGRYLWRIPLIISIVGALELIVQFITMGNIHEPHQSIMFVCTAFLIWGVISICTD